MSILLSFGPVPMSREEYLSVGDRIPEPPEGRDYHVCAGEDGALYITEVWDSEEHVRAWDEKLGPVLREVFPHMEDPLEDDRVRRPVVAVHRRGETFARP